MDKLYKILFGSIAAVVGTILMYAAWANPPFHAATLCGTTENRGVHLTVRWTLQYYNHCGGRYDHVLLYLAGVTIAGVTLIGGGLGTIREQIR